MLRINEINRHFQRPSLVLMVPGCARGLHPPSRDAQQIVPLSSYTSPPAPGFLRNSVKLWTALMKYALRRCATPRFIPTPTILQVRENLPCNEFTSARTAFVDEEEGETCLVTEPKLIQVAWEVWTVGFEFLY